MDQILISLFNRRNILLWKTNLKKKDLKKIIKKNINDTKVFLEKRNIKYNHIVLKPNDILYLPKYMWHKTETIDNKPAILCNLKFGPIDYNCNILFKKYWKKQALNCVNNHCIDQK